ncbi:restriction endonuclease subunit S [Bacteroides sp. AM41-16]|uniref:restriction endonuclease subunit S n=1 Tax=Bacteroides sp. AM41-16 TaxID=2292952 RepID=UPI000E7405E9|nr:restriction endonuclease subunit S [Bacteroides sp. AM41-16]RJU47137.1 restriction endonuclease subunit S [Bacteroides sp. AM41-16]
MADNNENKVLNVPHLRFPEFTDEWGKYKLSDVCSFFSGGTPSSSKKEYYDGSIPFIRSGELHMNKTELFITEEGLNNSAAKMVEIGDLLLALYGATSGDIAIGQIKGAINQAILCIRTTQNKKFIESVWKKHVEKLLQTYLQGGQGNLSADIVKNISFYFANSSEQMKLAKFISLLDERIATQNKIIKDLKKLKSAIVEMLLCNRNSELLKLGDIGYFVRGLTYANEDVTENKAATAVIRANNLNYGNHVDKGEVVYVSRTPATSQILRKGDIVICMANGSSALVGKNSYYPFNDGQSTVGAFCGIYRTSHPLAKWLMQSRRYKRLVYQSLQGGNGAIANLNGDDILNMSFPVMEKEKSKSIIFILETIEKTLAVNKCLQMSCSTQKSHLLKQMFI